MYKFSCLVDKSASCIIYADDPTQRKSTFPARPKYSYTHADQGRAFPARPKYAYTLITKLEACKFLFLLDLSIT